MSSHEKQLRELERVGRWRTLRNWALCLGVIAFLLAIAGANLVGAGSVAIAWEAPLRASVIVLISAGTALLIVGALLHGLTRWKHGEV